MSLCILYWYTGCTGNKEEKDIKIGLIHCILQQSQQFKSQVQPFFLKHYKLVLTLAHIREHKH